MWSVPSPSLHRSVPLCDGVAVAWLDASSLLLQVTQLHHACGCTSGTLGAICIVLVCCTKGWRACYTACLGTLQPQIASSRGHPIRRRRLDMLQYSPAINLSLLFYVLVPSKSGLAQVKRAAGGAGGELAVRGRRGQPGRFLLQSRAGQQRQPPARRHPGSFQSQFTDKCVCCTS